MAALHPIYHSNIPISSLCLLYQLLQNGSSATNLPQQHSHLLLMSPISTASKWQLCNQSTTATFPSPPYVSYINCSKMAALQPIYHSNIPTSSLCLLYQLLQNGCLTSQFYISQPSSTSARHCVIHESQSKLTPAQPVILTKLSHSVIAVTPINIYPFSATAEYSSGLVPGSISRCNRSGRLLFMFTFL